MGWIEEVESELARAREAQQVGNQGRVRTSARRAAGIAITALQSKFPEKKYGRDFMEQLRGFAGDSSLPESARSAAQRLQAKLLTNFKSPSVQPLADALLILHYVEERLSQSHNPSSAR